MVRAFIDGMSPELSFELELKKPCGKPPRGFFEFSHLRQLGKSEVSAKEMPFSCRHLVSPVTPSRVSLSTL